MKKLISNHFISAYLSLSIVFTLVMPIQIGAATANNNSFNKRVPTLEEFHLKDAFVEQLEMHLSSPTLHEDLQGLSGDQEVPVIIHLSEKPIALQKGLVEAVGEVFTASVENSIEAKVASQQQSAKEEMISEQITINLGFTYQTVLNGFSASVKADDLEKLLEIDGVTLVEPDEMVYAAASSEGNGEVKTAMKESNSFLGIDKLWKEGLDGKGVSIAVLDTGIDADHPEFKGVYKGGKNFVPHSSLYKKARAANDASETRPSEMAGTVADFNKNGSPFYTSHGTHVAGIIAANGSNKYNVKGIAPKVDLYAYRVLGAYGSGLNSSIVAAIEEAVKQDIDIINLSLGGGSNTETDAGSFAMNNAMLSGTVAISATGNSGPDRGSIGTPATSRLGIAVGNSTTPESIYSGTINVQAGPLKYKKVSNLMTHNFNVTPSKQLTGTYHLSLVPGSGTEKDYGGLNMKGKVALVSRGEIPIVDKIKHAKKAGATAILIYNNVGITEPSGILLGQGLDVIPAFDLSKMDGEAIKVLLSQESGSVTFTDFTEKAIKGDAIHTSSSRGPSMPNFDIKPDVVAPGTNIMSTLPMYKADNPKVSYDLAYGSETGTSMAAPHIAGIAVLLMQKHPDWTPFDVKVALSNTAQILDTKLYDVFTQGAGRVNPYAAVHPDILAFVEDHAVGDKQRKQVPNIKGTITFGSVNLENGPAAITKEIKVKDMDGGGGKYSVSVEVVKPFSDAKVTVDKPTFTINGEQTLNVSLTASQIPKMEAGDEIQGYIRIKSEVGNSKEISLPFAADFSGAQTEVNDFKVSESDLSFNGDGIKDEAKLSFVLTEDVTTNFIQLWNIMEPMAGVNSDGYIGYLYAAAALKAGFYHLNIDGYYIPGNTPEKRIIPDGLYAIDYMGKTVSGNPPIVSANAGPIVVKTTMPKIIGTVNGKKVIGKVTDKYIDYNKELAKYNSAYEINDKLKASYRISANGKEKAAVPFKLASDGSFNFPISISDKEEIIIRIEDAAGNIATQLMKRTAAENPTGFNDIKNHWARTQIEALTNRGIIAGKTATTFEPESKLTRAEFAVLLARSLDLPLKEYQGTFKDVGINKPWAYPGIEAAARAGIIAGKVNGKYEPDAVMTREEIAVMTIRTINYRNPALLKNLAAPHRFADATYIGKYAKDSIALAHALGLIMGRSGNTFDPKTASTRAETAVILHRVLKKLKMIE